MKKLLSMFVCLFLLGGLFLSLTACGSNQIKVYTRDTTSGTRDGFFTTIGFKEAKEDNTKLVAGYIEVDGNGSMITSVKNDKYGIGYISLSTLQTSGLKGLTYEGVAPTEANVLNKTYSLTRNFNYIVRVDNFSNTKVQQIVEAFQAFLTTKDAKTTMKANGGIIAINDTDPSWDSIKANYPICTENNEGVTVKFGGSTSVEKMSKALSSEFASKCGNFTPEHAHTGSGDAYKRTQGSEASGSNYCDIAFLSRELNSSETAATASSGFMCVDAIVVVVNADNAYSATDAKTLVKIFNGEIKTWDAIK